MTNDGAGQGIGEVDGGARTGHDMFEVGSVVADDKEVVLGRNLELHADRYSSNSSRRDSGRLEEYNIDLVL